MSQIGSLVPADKVIEFLKFYGAERTDAAPHFPGGRYFENIATYVRLMSEGGWEQTLRPIRLDAKTGTVWQGTDRTAAIAEVDWVEVKRKGLPVPLFNIVVQHAELASGDAPA